MAAAVGATVAWLGSLTAAEVLGAAAIGATVASAGVQAYSGYQANEAARTSAEKQTEVSRAAAMAQQMAAQAQADQLRDQSALANLQAGIEGEKAAIAQEQGEIEQARRSRLLAADIGNVYAQWAGNNLLVDGSGDSLQDLLSANVREAGQDIGIIKANTHNSVWEHEMNQKMMLVTAGSYASQAENAERVGEANAYTTILSGQAQAYATRQAGLTALYQGYGGAIGSLGSALGMGYRMAGGFGATSFGGGGSAVDIAGNTSGGWSATPTVTPFSGNIQMLG